MNKIEKLKNLARSNDKNFWRSLEELADDPQVKEYVKHEFPQSAGFLDAKITRNSFLKLMGSAIVMLSLPSCVHQPSEKIIPYSKAPEYMVPGKPLFFASAVSFGGYARGVLVESHMGRPTKIEGNPEHPDSLGATDPITQALLYQLYDPDRSRQVIYGGMPSSRDQFKNALHNRMGEYLRTHGKGLRFLTRPIISPSLASLREEILQNFPEAQWHQYSPLNADLARRACRQAYGKDLNPVYNVEKADVIVSIESDFLTHGAGAVGYANAFGKRRKVSNQNKLNRLYALESTPTLTGTMADHRLLFHPADLEDAADVLLQLVRGDSAINNHGLSDEDVRRLKVVAEDLQQNRSRSLIVAGSEQPVQLQVNVCHLNHLLNNVGITIRYTRPIEEVPEDQTESLQQLTAGLNDKRVTDLIMIDVNPAYASAADLKFNQAMANADFLVHMGLYLNETARLCHWHIPLVHTLESWGDLRAFDGTVTLRQPLIDPLYNGKSEYNLYGLFAGREAQGPLEMIRDYWRRNLQSADFDSFWRRSVHDGMIAGTAFETEEVTLQQTNDSSSKTAEPEKDHLAVLIRPDPFILDGQFTNNSWLQELPKPFTKLTWDNAALISPQTAKAAHLKKGDIIRISSGEMSVEAPVWILPGQAPDTVTLHLGYGRRSTGVNGNLAGFNAYLIQNSANPHFIPNAEWSKTGKTHHLVSTQHHAMMDGRELVLVKDLSEYQHNPDFVSEKIHPPKDDETLYDPSEHLESEYQWGMSINLNQCTGCSACTIACQVENNIPVVGKDQVDQGREMHWIRVDRYYEGSSENPNTYHQPVPCMQCENAPCEYVCPVEATTHSDEGLNEMTYNRCIGTRYCSNNCPYKVRHFNFLQFSKPASALLQLGHNPDVTVRQRGVMEKCTYCVQRINHARIHAINEGRKIQDGEIVTACQQVCPTNAITFGNINDPDSNVSKEKASPLDYHLLVEEGTRPRTSYLAKIKNPNPKMSEK